MNGFEIKFNIYAKDEQEVAMAREAIVHFINTHAQHGRAVTGRKIAEAVSRWDSNPFIKRKVIEFFS